MPRRRRRIRPRRWAWFCSGRQMDRSRWPHRWMKLSGTPRWWPDSPCRSSPRCRNRGCRCRGRHLRKGRTRRRSGTHRYRRLARTGQPRSGRGWCRRRHHPSRFRPRSLRSHRPRRRRSGSHTHRGPRGTRRRSRIPLRQARRHRRPRRRCRPCRPYTRERERARPSGSES